MPETPHPASAGLPRRCTADRTADDVPLPVLGAGGAAAGGHGKIRRSKAAGWRAGVLIGVHVVVGLHLLHWATTGRTVSPVEPSESMYTLELGELNAGFLFFAAALLLTLVFGRFVCGWACHIVALQDLCAHVMTKLGFRPKPFRSRLLVWVPLLVALYMFVWPTFKREVLARAFDAWWPRGLIHLGIVNPWPGFSNALLTEHFWKTFPPIEVAIPFLVVCGFATVYFLGAKGFCTYGCPYGGFFAPAQQFSPGRILVDLDRCEGCGHCTAVCTSNVRVHEEIQTYGGVVDPGCMKCLDCVSVCPNDALRFGFATPPAMAKKLREAPVHTPELSWGEEIGAACVFALAFFGTRGVYSVVPMLFALGIAGCATFVAIKCRRMLRDRDVRVIGLQLRRRDRITAGGGAFLALAALLFAFIGHSLTVNGLRWRGAWHDERVSVSREAAFSNNPSAIDPRAREHARIAERALTLAGSFRAGGIGLADTRGDRIRIAWLQTVQGKLKEAEASLRRGLGQEGPIDGLCADLAQNLRLQRRPEDAITACRDALRAKSDLPVTRDTLAGLLLEASRPDEAASVYRDRIAASPEDSLARARLAELLFSLGRASEGADELSQAASGLRTGDHQARAKVAQLLAQTGRPDEGLAVAKAGAAQSPDDAQARAGLGSFLLGVGRAADAAVEFDAAVRLRPRVPALRRDYALSLYYAGRIDDGVAQLRKAADMDLLGRAEHWRTIGRMLQEAGRSAEAGEWLAKASERERRLAGLGAD